MAIIRSFVAASALLFAASVAVSYAHTGHDHQDEEIESKRVIDSLEIERARAYFSDTVLTNHNGEDVRFYSDMLDGKTVVISFIFTECEDACPMINAVLNRVQTRLGARMGGIYISSLSQSIQRRIRPLYCLITGRNSTRVRPGISDGRSAID